MRNSPPRKKTMSASGSCRGVSTRLETRVSEFMGARLAGRSAGIGRMNIIIRQNCDPEMDAVGQDYLPPAFTAEFLGATSIRRFYTPSAAFFSGRERMRLPVTA